MSIQKVKFFYDYVKDINGTAKTEEKQINVYGFCCQISLETAYLEKYRHFNLAGIKCTKSWVNRGGECFNAKTPEDFGKGFVNTTGCFRKYNDSDHFLNDYSRLIHSYYPVSSSNPDCVYGYFAGLHGKWATDRNYFKKLCQIAKFLGPHLLGSEWKSKLTTSFNVALQRNLLEDWMIECVKSSLGIKE